MEPKDWLQDFKRQKRLSDFSERPEALLISVGQRDNHHSNTYNTRSPGWSWIEVWAGTLARRARVRIRAVIIMLARPLDGGKIKKREEVNFV